MYAECIRKYISEHLSERIAIPELADKMGISEGYMQNLFKNATGKSIIEFANEYKIRTAAEMATVYGMKLKDIAYQLGFDDPAYMSRLFKKIMGISFSGACKKVGRAPLMPFGIVRRSFAGELFKGAVKIRCVVKAAKTCDFKLCQLGRTLKVQSTCRFALS